MASDALDYSDKGALSYASGFTGGTSTKLFVRGKIGYLNINALKKTSSGTGSGWVTCATLPSSIKPVHSTQFIVANDADIATIFELRLQTDGTLQWYAPPSGINAWGGTAFLIS